MSTVGENILIMRKRLGWTQEELAKRMGYKSKSTINKIELGINDIPQSKIVKFADVLDTTPAQLMGWSENEIQETQSPDKQELTEGERKWLEVYHQLSDDTKKLLIEVANSFEKMSPDTQRFLLGAIRAEINSQK